MSIQPPVVADLNEAGALLKCLESPWYVLIGDLHDIILNTTVRYASSHGVRGLFFPVTTRTVTCPTALGSDSEPVPVTVSGVDTFLADSMQFSLEYGCRFTSAGCYSIMPSFRHETPDETHLGQFTHSEAEIIGDLDAVIRYVNGYVRALATAVLDRAGDRLAAARGDVSHIERMAGTEPFARITFEDAAAVVGDVAGTVRDGGTWRTLTRKGELLLLERVDEFVWVTHFDSLAVPFYQAFCESDTRCAMNADLFFGMGEVVGAGERHRDAEQLRKSMALHGVNELEYEWYVRMKESTPIPTAGFGMGIERFLMWVLNHHDIRDVPLISRVAEPAKWPDAILRP